MNPGQLIIDDTGETIGPETRAADFAESRAAAKGKIQFGVEQTEVELRGCSFSGTTFAVANLIFRGPTLSRIDLMLPIEGDEKGWANWTMRNEMDRKAAHENWAERTFSVRLELKPIDGIIPYEPGEDYPRSATMPWGEVASYYDSKGGFAYLCVRYGPEGASP